MTDLSYSTVGFHRIPLAEALEHIAAAGFPCVEVLGVDPHAGDPSQAQAVRQQLDRLGLRATTVHGPFSKGVLLSAPDEPRRTSNVRLLGEYLRFTGELGAKAMVVHTASKPAFVDDPLAAGIEERIREAARRSLDDLSPVAGRHGVRLLLENIPPYENRWPLFGMAELRPLVEAYPPEQVGLAVDVGHAWTSGIDPVAEIELAADRLHGIHLHDVDGEHPKDDHWVPGEGGLDWDAIRAALKRVGYPGAWTFEVANGRNGETPEQLAGMCRDFARQWGLDR